MGAGDMPASGQEKTRAGQSLGAALRLSTAFLRGGSVFVCEVPCTFPSTVGSVSSNGGSLSLTNTFHVQITG